MTAFLNDDSAILYGMEPDTPDFTPMYSALASANTIRQYQKQNNLEEVTAGLSWSECLEAGGTGIAHGLGSYGPEKLYQALRTMGKLFGSDDLRQFATEGIERERKIRELDPFYRVPGDWIKDGWGRNLYEGFRGISSSAYSMLPGAAISLLPGGQVIGLASIGLGGGGIGGLAEYDSFMEKAVTKFQGLNPALSRKDIEDSVFWDAVYSGVTEGGLEALTDVVGGKLIGLVGKAGVKPAKHIIDQLIRNVTKTVTLEAGSEVATAMVQDYLREHAGLDYQGRVEAFKSALGPALVGGAAFGVGGTALKLAQGKLGVDSAKSQPAQGDLKVVLDAKTLELQRQFREAHYSPKAVDAFNKATEGGLDYFKASSLMEAIKNTAQVWADRTGNKASDWLGDSGKVINLLKRLENNAAAQAESGDTALTPETLSSVRDLLLSELNTTQKQVLADTYGVQTTTDAQGDTVLINTDRLEADLKQVLTAPKSLDNIPETVRPVLEQMRNGLLDLHGLANKRGLSGGFDTELSEMIGKAVEYKAGNRPPPAPAFVIDEASLENIRKQYGDFSKLTAEKQTAMINDMTKAAAINFDKWEMPLDQKAMLGFIDSEMKPILDKVLNRGKRKDAVQEGLAKASLEKDGINLDRFAEFTAQLTGDGNIKESAAVKARELQLAERIFLAQTTELGRIANETLAPADIVKWHMAAALFEQVHGMLRAVRSESGHLLQAWKFIKKDPDLERARMEQMMDATGGLEAARYKLKAFAEAKTAADRAGVLADSLKAKTANMFLEYRTMNMLSSVKTHVVNTAGSALTLSNEVFNRWVAEKMGVGEGIARGETWAMMGGLWDGFKKAYTDWSTHKAKQGGTFKAVRNISEMVDVDPSSSLIGDAGTVQRQLTRQNTLDVIGGAKEWAGLSKEHGLISNGLATMVEYMGRVLGLSGDLLLTQDWFFKIVAAHGELAARNHRLAVQQSGGDKAKFEMLIKQFSERPPGENKLAAMAFGKLVTFQSDLKGFAKSMNEVRNKHPFVRGLVPFFKTPVNIMKYAAAHTPGLSKMFDDIRAELNSPDSASRHLAEARVMTGTFVWATTIGLAASGYLTGNGPVDKEEREKLRATGWQPNSLKVGDKYIALDRLDPAAMLLNTAATLVEIYDGMDGDDLDKAMWAGLGAAFRCVSNRTYLRSIADAVAAVNDWEGPEGDRARQGLFTSLVPASSMLRAVAQQVDPVQREVNGIFDAIRAGIPGASEALPVRRNFLGEEVKGDGYTGPDWLSPLRQSLDRDDPVYDEIYRLTKAGHAIPSMPSRIVHNKGKAVRMDGAQYGKYLELSGIGLRFGGMNAKEKLASVIRSRAYQGWDDEKKAKQVRAVIEGYRGEARKRMKTDPGIAYLLGAQ